MKHEAARRSGGTAFTTGIKVTITVLDAQAQACPTNPETVAPTQAVLGVSFNDGTGGPSDATGNIAAYLQMTKDRDRVSRESFR